MASVPTPPAPAVAHLALKAGRLLLENGADTRHTYRELSSLIAAFGHRGNLFISADALLVTVEGGGQSFTKVGSHLAAMGANMGRLMQIQRVLDDVGRGSHGVPALDARLDACESGSPSYPGALVMVGVAMTAASLARLFAADWPVVGVTFIVGALSTALRLRLAAHALNAVAAAFLTAGLSGLAGALIMHLLPGRSPTLCLVAMGMILVPGVPLINGMRDLISGHPANGVARLALGAVTVLSIGFALFLAAWMAGDRLPVEGVVSTLPLVDDMAFSALAAAGYALLFSVPGRAVWVCIVCGMASHGLRTALLHAGFDIASASLLGAAAAMAWARLCARWYGVPAVTFAFPGVVAMIPGSYAFRAAVGALDLMHGGSHAPSALLTETVSLAITTVLVTTAIAVGLAIVSSFPPILMRRSR